MKIKHIEINNFRTLRHFEYDCGKNMNVFFGANGAGKSTVLEAIEFILSWFTARMQSPTGRGRVLQDTDISMDERDCSLRIELDNNSSWKLFKQRSTTRMKPSDKSDLSRMNDLVKSLYAEFQNVKGIESVPFVSSYGVDRAVSDVPVRVTKKHLLNPIDIYTGVFDKKVSFRSFFEWFREREDIENEQYRNNPNFSPDYQLQAVRRALQSVLPEYGNLRIRRNPRAFIVDKVGQTFRFEQLSDGEKCYITLIADIARRMAMSHPEKDDPLQCEGIVLIDEVDLHLHPAWQQGVIDHLRQAFPHVQFFITTHSPFILSNIKDNDNEKITGLDNGVMTEWNENIYGEEVGNVLLKLFGLKTLRNSDVQKLIDHIWELLGKPEYNQKDLDSSIGRLRENLNPNDNEFVRIALEQAKLKR